jgi:anti-sigma factor RsiW
MGDKPCTWVRARLPLLAGGDGLGPDRRPVERHLLLCPACRRHLDALRASQNALHAAASLWPTRPDAPSLWPALAVQIRQPRRSERWDGVRAWLWPGLGLAAGLLGALVVLGLKPAPKLDAPMPASAAAAFTPPPPVVPAPRDDLVVAETPPAPEEGEAETEAEASSAPAAGGSDEIQFSR